MFILKLPVKEQAVAQILINHDNDRSEYSLSHLRISIMGEPVKPCNQNIRKTLELTDKMIQLADAGEAAREDVGCGVLYGVLRDAAFKLRKLAEEERKVHQRKGWWQEEKTEH